MSKSINTNKNRKKSEAKDGKLRKLGFILCFIQLVISAVFCYILINSQMIPVKYCILISILLAIIYFVFCFMQLKKNVGIVAKILSVTLSVSLIVLCQATISGIDAINKITETGTKIDTVDVYVNADDSAETLNDLASHKFGILSTLNRNNTDKAIEYIKSELDNLIVVLEYENIQELTNALYNKDVDAMIINQAYLSLITEMEGFEDFNSRVKLIKSIEIESIAIVKKTEHEITKNPFIIFISGADKYGTSLAPDRSDVNIIAVVNPATKQVLLQSTPRDYFIPLASSKGVKDKLTHAGLYGIDESIKTLEMLYDIDVNYYFRMNFTGFIEIIDALGGVDVESDYTFKTVDDKTFEKGTNTLSGEDALSFVRERKAFKIGDLQRGIHQMAVIEALLNKVKSPAILAGYSSIIQSVGDYFQTNFDYEEIAALVKMQLGDNADWNIVSNHAGGYEEYHYLYTMPNRKQSVIIPDMKTIEESKILINKVLSGEIINSESAQDTPNE